jgi:probable rRNA maturation factor
VSISKSDAGSLKQLTNLEIDVTGATGKFATQIEDAARAALQSQNHTRGKLHIAVIGGAEMGRQHGRWMNDPSPTDVLTFDLRDSTKKGLVDGELLVCSTVAKREAKRRGGVWRAELVLYVVHGCLHLCGFDDHDEAVAAAMHRQEDRILKKLGWGKVFAGTGKRPV